MVMKGLAAMGFKTSTGGDLKPNNIKSHYRKAAADAKKKNK